jgi:hypothetical protein
MSFRITLFIAILCCFCQQVSSQEKRMKFGYVMPENFRNVEFDNENDENAVIISDLGEVQYVQPEVGVFNLEFTHHRRILILKNTGSKYANVVIPLFYKDIEQCEILTDIQAASYNLNGDLVVSKQINKSDIHEIRSDLFTKQIRFAIPDVKAGTIIEFKYTTRSPIINHIPKWYFQKEIPVLYSEYSVKMVPSFQFDYVAKGIEKFDVLTVEKGAEKKTFGKIVMMNAGNVGSGYEYNDLIYTFGLKNIPAYRQEVFSSSNNDHIIHIDFQLNKIINKNYDNKSFFNTWEDVVNHLLEGNLGKRIKAGKTRSKTILNELEIQNVAQTDKAKFIIEYVRKNYLWDGRYDYLPSVSAKELLTNKTGNSADINFLLFDILQAADIDVYPVLISTRSNGQIEESAPFINVLNNVVLLIDEGNVQYLTDGTTSFVPYNRIPAECLNEMGLKIEQENFEWVTLESFSTSELKSQFVYNLSPVLNQHNVKVTLIATEYLSEFYRELWKKGDLEIKEYYKSLGIYNIANIRKSSRPSGKQYSLSFDAFTPLLSNNQRIILYPFKDRTFFLRYLVDESRKTSLDFGFKRKYSVITEGIIPDGFDVKSLPEALSLTDDLIHVNIFYSVVDKKLSCTLFMDFKKIKYSSTEYSALSQHVRLINQHILKPVVLVNNLN